MAVSRAWLSDKICDMCGYVRKKAGLVGFTKKELLVIYAYLNLEQDGGDKKVSKR